ncbi:MAG: HAMP domain-containing histidine kinase [Candidatus Pacebacteria bacterium]|jgi:signal transduction histidine kinase|nr:HAMP domain-containing histidine kinase [Candidatus Paceibacterota bacterium]
MFNIINNKNKYTLRNSHAIPFFYEKFKIIPRTFGNLVHFITLGRIANGVLHDLINPLTSLLLLLEIKDPSSLQEISKSSKELSKFVRVMQCQLKNINEKEYFSISKLINDSSVLIKYKALINNIRIVTIIQKEFYLYGNKIILMRAILNIVNNAIESYEKCPADKRDVVISIYDEKDILNISIRDFGCGISDKDRKKIFRYFYTNKINGTGIGLPTSYKSIRKEYSGNIAMENYSGEGCNFIIQIPLKTSI